MTAATRFFTLGHQLAVPVGLETKVSDFHDRARGAAVLAIKVLVLGSAEARRTVNFPAAKGARRRLM
ncbi:hypothetical protein ACFZDI_13065 [Streptomyces sp. NPDC007907]|uniref:hypothetical protein n=1 Tax=Streptomyces sp. NPDC007907 TaxID=3364789 RepID=UPI0036F0987B